MSVPGRVGCTWQLSSACLPGKPWAGQWPGLYPQGIYGLGLQMRTSLVNGALLRAIWKRKPPKGLLRHGDRGSQYAATSHRKTTKRFGIRQSMGRKGNCWGSLPLGYNAVAGSFFHALKTELTHRQTFRNREEAKQAVFE